MSAPVRRSRPSEHYSHRRSIGYSRDPKLGPDNQGGNRWKPRSQVLITATELASLIQSGDPVTILDVRWRLDTPDGRPRTWTATFPARCMCRWTTTSATTPLPGGAAPLPAGASLQEALRRWGVREGGRSWCTTIGIEPVRGGPGGC